MFRKLKNISGETWVWLVLIVVNIALIMALLSQFLISAVVVGDSMNPTLKSGWCMVAVAPGKIAPGEVVIAKSEAAGTTIVKRVIAVPGDTVAIVNNTVYRNGKALTEDYLPEGVLMENMVPLTLQEDMYFLMGDNRNISLDSRLIGPVSAEQIRYRIPMDAQLWLWILRLLSAVGVGVLSCLVTEWETEAIVGLWEKRSKNREVAALE